MLFFLDGCIFVLAMVESYILKGCVPMPQRARIKQVRVTASVPNFCNEELERLAGIGYMTKSALVSLIVMNGLPWAEKLVDKKFRDQPLRSGD